MAMPFANYVTDRRVASELAIAVHLYGPWLAMQGGPTIAKNWPNLLLCKSYFADVLAKKNLTADIFHARPDQSVAASIH